MHVPITVQCCGWITFLSGKIPKVKKSLADLSFALSFADHAHFMYAMDLCGHDRLNVTDSIIGEERAIIFWDVVGFLAVANIAFREKWSVHLHLLNNTVQFF